MEEVQLINSRAVVGGKAASLFELENVDVLVPPFFVVPPQETVDNEKLVSRAEALCSGDNSKEALFAVRSSGLSEDGTENAFAGLHDTFLNCEPNTLFEAVQKVRYFFFSLSLILSRLKIDY